MLDQPLQAQRLDGEGHIHDLRRMAVAGGQVHQAAFAHHVQGAAIGQGVTLDVFTADSLLHRQLAQAGHVHLAVEVTGVGEDGLILHDGEVTGGDDVLTAGGGDKEVAHLGGLVHGHDPIAVHGGVQGFERVNLGDDDIGAHALGTHGHALAAPAVTGDDHGLTGDDQVGGVHDGGHDRLAGAVFVVIVVLGLGIVDGHHGAGKDTLPFPRLQAQDAGGSLLTAANEAVAQLLAAAADEVDEIAAVVHDQVGVARQGFHQQVFVLLRSDAVDAIGIHAHAGDACGHIVLSG